MRDTKIHRFYKYVLRPQIKFILFTVNDIQPWQDDLSRLESKIRDLEGELDRNQLAVVKLRETAMDMLKKQVNLFKRSKHSSSLKEIRYQIFHFF